MNIRLSWTCCLLLVMLSMSFSSGQRQPRAWFKNFFKSNPFNRHIVQQPRPQQHHQPVQHPDHLMRREGSVHQSFQHRRPAQHHRDQHQQPFNDHNQQQQQFNDHNQQQQQFNQHNQQHFNLHNPQQQQLNDHNEQHQQFNEHNEQHQQFNDHNQQHQQFNEHNQQQQQFSDHNRQQSGYINPHLDNRKQRFEEQNQHFDNGKHNFDNAKQPFQHGNHHFDSVNHRSVHNNQHQGNVQDRIQQGFRRPAKKGIMERVSSAIKVRGQSIADAFRSTFSGRLPSIPFLDQLQALSGENIERQGIAGFINFLGPLGGILGGVVAVTVAAAAAVAVASYAQDELNSSGRDFGDDFWEMDHSVWLEKFDEFGD